MGHIKIANRLYIGFGALAGILLVIAWLGMTQMASINTTSSDIANKWLPSVESANKISIATANFRVFEMQHVNNAGEAGMAEAEKQIQVAQSQLDDARKRYEQLIATEEERSLYQSFSEGWQQYAKA